MILQHDFGHLSDRFRNIQGPTDRQIVELHWRDAAVFVSLSSRTNTRQGQRREHCAGDAAGTQSLVVRGL